jgi:glutaredoxin
LYSREGCHLCDEMAAQLQALGVEFDKVDVDSDPQLRLRYGRDVPVLVFQDVVIKHRLSPEAIAKLR